MDHGETRKDVAPGSPPRTIIGFERLVFQIDGSTPSIHPSASLPASRWHGTPRPHRASRAITA